MKNITCKSCLQTLPQSSFYHSKAKNGNLYPSSSCKKCDNSRSRDYHKANKEKRKAQHRAWRNKTRYYLSANDFNLLLEAQSYSCAICGVKNSESTLHVDHDHSCCPGKNTCGECIRGLLCNNCNNGLGRFQDDANKLIAAIKYLNRSDCHEGEQK